MIKTFFWSAGVLLLGNIADVATTAAFLHAGGEEASIIAKPFMEQHGAFDTYVVKLALATALTLVSLGIYGLLSNKTDKARILFAFRGATIWYTLVSVTNLGYFFSLSN